MDITIVATIAFTVIPTVGIIYLYLHVKGGTEKK
jgi:hypothetical protein